MYRRIDLYIDMATDMYMDVGRDMEMDVDIHIDIYIYIYRWMDGRMDGWMLIMCGSMYVDMDIDRGVCAIASAYAHAKPVSNSTHHSTRTCTIGIVCDHHFVYVALRGFFCAIVF